MPYDKAKNNANRPLKPTLATNRNVKSPITPRLAASATPPLTRKSTQSDLAAAAIRKTTSREQLSTPVQAFLNNNVTPRSSSRKSRVDSAQSTPDGGTPTIARPSSAASNSHGTRNGGGYAFNNGSHSRPKSVVGSQSASNSPLARSVPFINTGLQISELQSDREVDSKFFRANDARSPDLVPTQKKTPAFFYANGQQEETSGRPAAAPSPPLSAVSARSARSQFFRANGAEVDDIPPLPSPPLVAPSPKPLPVETLQRAPIFFRPPSSENIHLSYRKGASQVIKPGNRANALPLLSPTSFQTPAPSARRRSGSAETSGSRQEGKSHNRTSSLSSIESLPPSRKSSVAAAESVGYFGLSPLATSCQIASSSGSSTPSRRGGSAPASAITPDPSSVTPIPQNRTSSSSEPEESMKAPLSIQTRSRKASASLSVPQSPTKLNSSAPQSLSELAANARRERKVMDLEISNSSLLAINRQLEREVRKQKAELRRFRRLTRTGRLSSLSIFNLDAKNGVGGNDDAVEAALEGVDELSDEDGSFEDENLSEDEEDSTDDSALSPSTLAERDERKLAKDSKRLQLDLSRHRELLIDSQKMNQALKRCMAWTEEMIKDGKKALEYRVRVDEVRLGGHVLERENLGGEEADEESAEHHRLVSAWSPTSVPNLEASRDGVLGLGIVRSGSWQSEILTSPEKELDMVADLSICGAEMEPLIEG